tara:strand:- start:344 stop:556 length:213 start_codon:yes stop_codon:yes gene_type:complete
MNFLISLLTSSSLVMCRDRGRRRKNMTCGKGGSGRIGGRAVVRTRGRAVVRTRGRAVVRTRGRVVVKTRD